MLNDPDIDFELRTCHAFSKAGLSFEDWKNSLIRQFKSQNPGIDIKTHPKTFTAWVVAQTVNLMQRVSKGQIH